MSAPVDAPFFWEPQPRAYQVVLELMRQSIASAPWLQNFERRLATETGTRIFDWLDHLIVPDADPLLQVGFEYQPGDECYHHPAGLFPRVVVAPGRVIPELAFLVEDVEDFLRVHGLAGQATIAGPPFAPLRIATVPLDGSASMRVVERHGGTGFRPNAEVRWQAETLAAVREHFRSRHRDYHRAEEAFADAETLYRKACGELPDTFVTSLFFETERSYWQNRNRAASVQHRRQQALGLGWANHDHHTYRCSRPWFAPLVRFLESIGFSCRERFYAGDEAGWGAQVLEDVACGIVIFADVDMTADEITGDFAHAGLSVDGELGTVGLWCQLHGDSFVSAGMHHLECQFDFERAREQLAHEGIPMMVPFTDFPYLKQAFTRGELWRVPEDRLQSLLGRGVIDPTNYEQFRMAGAIGSHLEVLERNDGYKGFNQTGISKIIRETNPKTARD